jgi:histidinol-phosphate aminotransferase
MDANESFLLPTDEDKMAMFSAVADVALNRYPDPLATRLCCDFASLYDISPEFVTAGNGSDELISIIMSTFLQKGEKVLTLTPDFSMYRFYTAITETPCVTLDKNPDLTIDIDRVLKKAENEKVKMLIFSNPCNPTSLGIKAEEVRKLISGTNALVVLDEAYMDFWDQSLINEAHLYDNLILLRTSSKALGMAALRLGFAVANSRLTAILQAAKSPYNVNAVTQAMASIVLKNRMYKTVYNEILLTSRDMLVDGFRNLENKGLVEEVYQSRTNFAYIRLNDAMGVFNWLADRGVIVRRFGENYLRITAGKQEENRELLSAMEVFLKKTKTGNDYEKR